MSAPKADALPLGDTSIGSRNKFHEKQTGLITGLCIFVNRSQPYFIPFFLIFIKTNYDRA